MRPGRGGNANGCALRLGTNPDARVCGDGRWSENRREYPGRVIRADKLLAPGLIAERAASHGSHVMRRSHQPG